ncbi:MAG: hypothetical protein HZB76_01265 [Chlamydiae bacterium]|nr:hypothetical protein [Chlamydiota bacterium]
MAAVGFKASYDPRVSSLGNLDHFQSDSSYYMDMLHRVHVVSNEVGQIETQEELNVLPISGNTIMGVSGFRLLNYAAIRVLKDPDAIKYIIALDRSLMAEAFWQDMNNIIIQSQTKEEAQEKIIQTIRQRCDRYFKGCLSPSEYAETEIFRLEGEIKDNLSWLSTDAGFHAIQNIFLKNNFRFLHLDLFDQQAIFDLKDLLNQSGVTLDTFYLSNVYEYLPKTKIKFFATSIAALIDENTITIDTKPRSSNQKVLIQRILNGKKKFMQGSVNPKFKHYYSKPISGIDLLAFAANRA